MTSRPTRATAAGRAYLDLQNLARRQGRPTDELHQMYAPRRIPGPSCHLLLRRPAHPQRRRPARRLRGSPAHQGRRPPGPPPSGPGHTSGELLTDAASEAGFRGGDEDVCCWPRLDGGRVLLGGQCRDEDQRLVYPAGEGVVGGDALRGDDHPARRGAPAHDEGPRGGVGQGAAGAGRAQVYQQPVSHDAAAHVAWTRKDSPPNIFFSTGACPAAARTARNRWRGLGRRPSRSPFRPT